MRGSRAISYGSCDSGLGKCSVGNKVLRAVQHPAAVTSHSRCTHRTGVGAGARFSETPGAKVVAFSDWCEVLLFLGFTCGYQNVTTAKRVVGGNRKRDRGIDASKFLHYHGVFYVAEPRSAVLF